MTRRLRDAVLLGRVPLSSVCVLLPILIFSFLLASMRYGFFFATLPRRPASRSRLFNVYIDTTCEASVSQTRHSNVLVLLLSCAPVPPSPFSILVRASLRWSVKGVVHSIVHSIVRDLQFFGNFSHGIAFISQNKNRLTSFRRKFFVSSNFEPVIKPTNADASDSQIV